MSAADAHGGQPALPPEIQLVAGVIESLPVAASIVVGPDYRVVAANAGFREIASGRGDPIGWPLREIWPEAGPISAFLAGTDVADLAGARRAARLELRRGHARATGRFTLSCSPLPAADGSLAGLLVLLAETADTNHERATDAGLLERERFARAELERINARLEHVNQQLIQANLRTQRVERWQRLLAQFSHALAGSLDYRSTVEQIARFPAGAFCDYCVLYLVGEDGAIRRIAGAHADPELDHRLRALHAEPPADPVAPGGLLTRTVATGQSHILVEVGEDWLRSIARSPRHAKLFAVAKPTSIIVTALAARGRTFGVISFMQTRFGKRFAPEDVELAEALSARAGLALDNARLYLEAQVAEQRYRAVFEGAADAILVADADLRYVEANPAAIELLGRPLDEIRARRVGDFNAAESEQIQAQFADLADGRALRGATTLRRKNGQPVPIEYYTRQIQTPDGPMYLSALRDVSERHDFERLQQEFMALVTHELRSPLTSIRGFAQLMHRRGEYDEAAVEAIIGQTRRQERLVNDLLDVARLESGRLQLEPGPVELTELLQSVAQQAQVLTRAHAISVDAPGPFPVGTWDRGRIEQVLDNLISNAIKYSPNGGEVLVVAADLGDRARVTVADEGDGIEADIIGHIFERFYRGTAGKSIAGIGLGLYIVRSLVEAHGGSIHAESTPGKGSRFTFELPYRPPR